MIEHTISLIIDYLRAHPALAQVFTFFIALAESLPLIGTIIPGSITMTAIGTLIGSHILPGFSTLAWASVGAFTGDCIGFWVGKRYDQQLRHMWPFKKYPHWLEWSEKFIEKHGGKSIIFGRFVGPARSTVPLVAGLLKLTWPRFAAAGIPSAILWALLYMTPGIALGAIALELPPAMTTKGIVFGLVVILILWFILWVFQRFFKELALFINRMVDKLWDWLNRHYSSHFIIVYITNRQKIHDHHQLTLLLLSLLSGLLFLLTFASVMTHGVITHLNLPLFHFFQSIRSHFVDTLFISITLFAQVPVMLTAGVLTSIGLWLAKQRRAGIHMLFLVVATAGVVFICKHVYHSLRPQGFFHVALTSSFPSGHSTLSLAIIGFICFLTASRTHKKHHWISYLIGSLLVLLIFISRLYLGAHWLSDIVGSLFAALTVLFAVTLNYRRFPKTRSEMNLPLRTWLMLMIPCFLFPWFIYLFHQYDFAQKRYTPITHIYKISMQNWWQDPTTYSPMYRNNRFGLPVQPFNIQWASPLTQVQAQLEKHGWTVIMVKRGMKNALLRYSHYNKKFHLPLITKTYHKRPRVLIAFKSIEKNEKNLYQLELWRSQVRFTNSRLPLWIGSIGEQMETSMHIAGTKHYPLVFSHNKGIYILENELAGFDKELIQTNVIGQPKRIQNLNWAGQILVVKSRP